MRKLKTRYIRFDLLTRLAGLSPSLLCATLLLGVVPGFVVEARAQGDRGGAAPAAPVPGKDGAPIDLTGYWVSVISEDWRFRMVTPPKGDYQSVPLNAEARKVADTWDPDADEKSENRCKSYGVGMIMRVPGRLHITWQDDNTLKIETDAGMQTRLLHFGSWTAPGGDPASQGDSVAQWELTGASRRTGGFQLAANDTSGRTRERTGHLKAVTTHMRAGYVRKNGIPYSEDALITEYYDLYRDNDETWFTVTTVVDDPKYFQQPFITSSNFKRQPDAAGWDPTPCSAKW